MARWRRVSPCCFSALNHYLAHCYDATRVVKWLAKQAAHGFQGASGSFSSARAAARGRSNNLEHAISLPAVRPAASVFLHANPLYNRWNWLILRNP
jgi:hypothetical protein